MRHISVWFILEISQLPLVAAGKGNAKQLNHHDFREIYGAASLPIGRQQRVYTQR